jgi:hypothetical protein
MAVPRTLFAVFHSLGQNIRLFERAHDSGNVFLAAIDDDGLPPTLPFAGTSPRADAFSGRTMTKGKV